VICDPQSEFRIRAADELGEANPQSAIRNPQSAIRNL
jgi:hypothetical protein